MAYNGKKRGKKKGSKTGSKFNSSNGNHRYDDTRVDSVVDRTGKGGNDPSWYNKFGELINTAANLSWSYALGAPIAITPDGSNPHLGPYMPSKEVGLLHSKFIPCFGTSDDLGDPVNKCAVELYSQLRYNKSGNVGYDPADIIQMLATIDSIYMFIATCQRAYGVLNMSTPTNRYMPRDIITTLGFDFDDILRNKANFNYFINSLMVKAAKINVPRDLTVMDRHTFLCANIFKDEDIERASLFAYSPDILWKYNWTDARCDSVEFMGKHEGSGGSITPHLWTYDELYTLGYDLLASIEKIEDFYTMNANILAAYGYDKLYKLAPLAPMYTTIPIFRQEMLIQLHNSDYLGWLWATADMKIDQIREGDNLGAIVFKPVFRGQMPTLASFTKFVDIPFENPSHDDIMEATRFKVSTQYIDGDEMDQMRYYVKTSGTEILTSVVVLNARAGLETGEWLAYTQEFMVQNADLDPTDYVRAFKINMSPLIPQINGNPFTQKYNITYYMGDFSNYAVLEYDKLMNLHECALLSELNVSRNNLQNL